MKIVLLDGNHLRIEDVYEIAHDSSVRVALDARAITHAARAERFLGKVEKEKIIYGVNTGFGPMASHIIGRDEIIALQKNLIRGHAMGMGNALPEEYVIAAMVVRLNTLLKGYSGVSAQVLRQLETFINRRIVPIVPEHGAVGTSGDLVQLAHIALALIGEGEVFYKGKRQATKIILKKLKISPHTLNPKEGLSLINGTSMMAGIAALLCVESERLVSIAIGNGAFALESVHSFTDSISARLHELRPHHGQQVVAKTLRSLTSTSKLLRDRKRFQGRFSVTGQTHVIPESVQEVYSFRCIPQVIGPIFDTVRSVAHEVEIEINSVTDNPVVDEKNDAFLHGGNFHGDYIAAGVDRLKAGIVKLTMLSERRVNFFMHRAINGSFPPFLNLKTPGLTMGLQGLQFVATSTTARSQTLAYPHHVHSIPTNADNQDIVSMGTDAAIIAAEVIENAYVILSIELIAFGQLGKFLGHGKDYSLPAQKLLREIQKVFPPIVDDRAASGELARVVRYAKDADILDMKWRNE